MIALISLFLSVTEEPGVVGSGAPTMNFQRSVTTDDYPVQSLREGREGTVRYILSVDKTGHVADCTIVVSSGTPELDETACRIMRERATFYPARNAQGTAKPFTFKGQFTWRIPKDPRALPFSTDMVVDLDVNSEGMVVICKARDQKRNMDQPEACASLLGRPAPMGTGKPMHLRLRSSADATALPAEPVAVPQTASSPN